MAIKGLRANAVMEYISKEDPAQTKDEGATVFYGKSIPNSVITRIADQQQTSTVSMSDMGAQTYQMRTHHRNREAFRFGINGWDNFFDEGEQPIQYETELVMEGGKTFTVVSEGALDRIPGNLIQEIGQRVWNDNNLTETQRKNFEDLSSRFEGISTSSAQTVQATNEQSEDATDQQESSEQEAPPPGAAIITHQS